VAFALCPQAHADITRITSCTAPSHLTHAQFAGASLGGPNPFTQQPGAPGSAGLANASGAAAAGPGSGSAGAAGAAADTTLAESGSVKPSNAIRSEHVICASELMLKEVIGAGAEGKVGVWVSSRDSVCALVLPGEWPACALPACTVQARHEQPHAPA
jgi:hypothetical protein